MRDELRDGESKRGRSFLPVFFGPTIWAVHFCVSYGVAAIWCAKWGDGVGGLVWTIVALTVVALALIGFVGWRAWRQWDYTDDWDYEHAKATDEHRREFLGYAGVLLALVSGIGVAYMALPALLTSVCR